MRVSPCGCEWDEETGELLAVCAFHDSIRTDDFDADELGLDPEEEYDAQVLRGTAQVLRGLDPEEEYDA